MAAECSAVHEDAITASYVSGSGNVASDRYRPSSVCLCERGGFLCHVPADVECGEHGTSRAAKQGTVAPDPRGCSLRRRPETRQAPTVLLGVPLRRA